MLYMEILSFINNNRKIDKLEDIVTKLKQHNISEEEIENILYDLHKWGRIKWIIFHSNGHHIHDWIVLNARGIQMLQDLQKKLEINNQYNNYWNLQWNMWSNYGSIVINNDSDVDEIIKKLISEIKLSNISWKEDFIKALESNDKKTIKPILLKIISSAWDMASIGQLALALFQFFSS